MNFKKVFLASMLAVVLIFSSIAFASNASDVVIKLTIGNPEMTVNGKAAEIDPGRGTAPLIRDGRTLVPIRSIIEAMGGSVEWDAKQSMVILKLKEDKINLTIDSVTASFNGVESTLDVAPVIINERTMLPIRYIAESFKFDVEWDGVVNTVTVTKKSAADSTYDEYIEYEYLGDEFLENLEDEYLKDEFLEDEFLEDEFFEDEYFEEEDEFLEDEFSDDEI